MNYKMLTPVEEGAPQIYARVDDDGLVRVTCGAEYPPLLEWIAAGNTPEPAETIDPWQAIRTKRDQLIRESDWTMTPGATVDQAQWTAYRQVLRDLPQTYENAEDVVWPTVPSTSGPNTIED